MPRKKSSKFAVDDSDEVESKYSGSETGSLDEYSISDGFDTDSIKSKLSDEHSDEKAFGNTDIIKSIQINESIEIADRDRKAGRTSRAHPKRKTNSSASKNTSIKYPEQTPRDNEDPNVEGGDKIDGSTSLRLHIISQLILKYLTPLPKTHKLPKNAKIDDNLLFWTSRIVNGRWKCPLSCCKKDFLNKAGIVYHMTHHLHDVNALFSYKEEDEAATILLGSNAHPINYEEIRDLIKNTTSYPISIGEYALCVENYPTPSSISVLFTNMSQPAETVSSTTVPIKKSKQILNPMPCSSHFTDKTTEYPDISLFPQYSQSQHISLVEFSASIYHTHASTSYSINKTQYMLVPLSSNSHDGKHILNTGGPVWSLTFLPGTDTLICGGYAQPQNTVIGMKKACPGNMQVWECIEGRYVCSILICHDWGALFDVSICPGSNILCVLACSFGDGSARIICVPRLRNTGTTQYVKIIPQYTYKIDHTLLWRCCWRDATRLTIGCMNGHVALYDTNHLSSQPFTPCSVNGKQMTPVQYVSLHDSAVRAIVHVSENVFLSTSNDGRFQMTDLDDIYYQHVISRTRTFQMSCSKVCGFGVFTDTDYNVRVVGIDEVLSIGETQTWGFIHHENEIWNVDGSLFIPFVGSCSADGHVKIGNCMRTNDRQNKSMTTCLYRIEFEENGVYVFKEDGVCKEWNKNGSKNTFHSEQVGVHKVAWSKNKQNYGMIASGGYSGLVRVENTLKNK